MNIKAIKISQTIKVLMCLNCLVRLLSMLPNTQGNQETQGIFKL